MFNFFSKQLSENLNFMKKLKLDEPVLKSATIYELIYVKWTVIKIIIFKRLMLVFDILSEASILIYFAIAYCYKSLCN